MIFYTCPGNYKEREEESEEDHGKWIRKGSVLCGSLCALYNKSFALQPTGQFKTYSYGWQEPAHKCISRLSNITCY